MVQAQKTVFHECHLKLGAKMTDFGGWDMPLQYSTGIINEHLATRKSAGLFDISHMGRFTIRGTDALPFLQHVLSNNAAALDAGLGQYTIIPNGNGAAVDDAYLYQFVEGEFLLVVNAANRENDWSYLDSLRKDFPQTVMEDRTLELAMLGLQGPRSKELLLSVLDSGALPEPMRNALSVVVIGGARVLVARTGYTGEPICFELFMERQDAVNIWNLLADRGAVPVGLGARDTLRLEAGLPLYGHELGLDPAGKEIPIFAMRLSRFAVSFSAVKGNYVGREALARQFEAFERIMRQDHSLEEQLPRMIMPLELSDKGIARGGDTVFRDGDHVGYVTSGTMVPYWKSEAEGISARLSDDTGQRAIALALLDSRLVEGEEVQIDIRGKRTRATIVPCFLRSEAPPYARPAIHHRLPEKTEIPAGVEVIRKVGDLLDGAMRNTIWRQTECINLIPSEMTPSSMTRLLSIMDPSGRYAEHRRIKALEEAEVFFYQGTDFIAQVEEQLQAELCAFLGCRQVEARVISGQMANTAVFSAMVDYLNRADRRSEQRRLRKVLNNHIIKGGHLSAQPMGALRDFVAQDPTTEKPAVVNFPVLMDNPYMIDMAATKKIIAEHRPELVILGKSLTLHREPVAEVRTIVDELGVDCVVMYDMAHVLGLVGPYFQQPFREGADLVTGSTHKTYFGSQRGIIACDYDHDDRRFPLWEAVERRTFPGSVSNHHLGTMLGLLMAAYEMNHFRDEYQRKVLANAKAFARHLKDCGLDVLGDPDLSYTETHQVLLRVGYSKGAEFARRLEDNNIILNYQATPEEEGFTAAGSLRMGVSEMTRFGMEEQDFGELAQYLHEVIVHRADVKDKVASFRKRFLEMKFCFSKTQFEERLEQLHKWV